MTEGGRAAGALLLTTAGDGITTAVEGSAVIAGGGAPAVAGVMGAASVADAGGAISLPGPNHRVAMSAPNAPKAAAAKIQAARGRSRTRMIVGSTTRSPRSVLELTGMSELPTRSWSALVLAAITPGVPGLSRKPSADDEAA